MDECFNYVRQIIPEMESHFITPIPSQPVPTFLAHMDGTEGSTTFLDSADSHVITVMGNTHVDATTFKFGTGSAVLDGSGDGLHLDGSADFTYGTGDFTIDFWIRLNATGVQQKLYYNDSVGATIFIDLYIWSDNKIYLTVGGVDRITSTTGLTTGSWYHIALTRGTAQTRLFLNGTQEGGTYSDSNDYLFGGAPTPYIGIRDGGTFSLNGWIDELRIIKGTAYWTSDFTPPTAPYYPP